MEEPTLKEMAEYFIDANREEFMSDNSGGPVTVILYSNGDKLNFYRLVDRDTASSLSLSLRWG